MIVLFSLIEKSNGEHVVEFNFENESLKHKLDNTMRTNMFEVSEFLVFIYNCFMCDLLRCVVLDQ